MAPHQADRNSRFARAVATGATALVLGLSTLPSAFSQTRGDAPGLRGLTPAGQSDPIDASPLAAQLRSSTASPRDPGAGLVSPPPPPATYSAGAGDPGPAAAINYGKPRKLEKRPLPNPPLKNLKRPLPPLEPYRTSSLAKKRSKAPVDPAARPDQPPTGAAVVPTIVAKPRKVPEDKPFEPTGISIGSLRLKPYIEGAGGYDSNPARIETPRRGYPALHGDAGLAVQSEWSQHALKGEMRVGYTDFPGFAKVNRPDGAGKIDGRIDVLRDTTIDVGGNFGISTLRPNSPELQWGSAGSTSTNQPITWMAGGYVGGTQKFNRLEASLRGIIERSQTGDATYLNGTTQQLSRNDYTTMGVQPRLTYEVTPGLKPFVQATIDRRAYDQLYDVNGYMRSSNGAMLRGGASFEVTRQVTGELSGGYAQRNYEDPRLVPLRGPVFDVALIWTATPLTTVKLRGGTTLNETTVPGASGSITRKITGEISHALFRNVTITGIAGYAVTNYQGASFQGVGVDGTNVSGINERLLTAGVKAEYSLTRTVVIKASYAFEKLKTTVQGSDYTSNVFLLGLRLQR